MNKRNLKLEKIKIRDLPGSHLYVLLKFELTISDYFVIRHFSPEVSETKIKDKESAEKTCSFHVINKS